MTYSPGHTWTECKNRDPVFGFQVIKPHLETGERCTIHVILIHYSNKTENRYELTHWHLKGYGPPQHVSHTSTQIQTYQVTCFNWTC